MYHLAAVSIPMSCVVFGFGAADYGATRPPVTCRLSGNSSGPLPCSPSARYRRIHAEILGETTGMDSMIQSDNAIPSYCIQNSRHHMPPSASLVPVIRGGSPSVATGVLLSTSESALHPLEHAWPFGVGSWILRWRQLHLSEGGSVRPLCLLDCWSWVILPLQVQSTRCVRYSMMAVIKSMLSDKDNEGKMSDKGTCKVNTKMVRMNDVTYPTG
jgi:hypothetical protein